LITVAGGHLDRYRALPMNCLEKLRQIQGHDLAEPANWGALTDQFTTLCLSAASATAIVPGVGEVTRFAATAVPIIGRFVQLLADASVHEKFVPGLAAMEPGGDIVNALNTAGDGRVAKPGYCAITANFEPGALGDGNSSVPLKALDQIVDDLFKADNDLVVDTTSMSTFWPGIALDAVDSFGKTHDVYHTCYFINERVADRLAQWLGVGAAPGGDRQTPPAPTRQRTRSAAPFDTATEDDFRGPRIARRTDTDFDLRVDLPAGVHPSHALDAVARVVENVSPVQVFVHSYRHGMLGLTSFRSRGHHSSRRSPCGPRKGHRHGSDPAGSSPFPCGGLCSL
jgi:hypothetical protein